MIDAPARTAPWLAAILLLPPLGCDRGSPRTATPSVERVALTEPALEAPAQPLQATESDHSELARALSGAFRGAAAVAMPSVARVRTERVGRRNAAVGGPRGSGFVLDASGLVVTNHHVVNGASRVQVSLAQGRTYEAEVVGSDSDSDVAVLQLRLPEGETVPAATLGDAENVAVGDWVLALGSPLDLEFTVTAGIVSAKGRSLSLAMESRRTAVESFIQTDAAINPGNSGGPLVDLDGRVIGVNAAIQSTNRRFIGYGFAIPIDIVVRIARDLIEDGVVHRPLLGVSVRDLTDADAEAYGLDRVEGAWISVVQPGLAADRAGLRQGDVVLAIDGEPIATANDLTAKLVQRRPDDRVRLTLRRFSDTSERVVQLDEFETSAPNRPRPLPVAVRPEERLGFVAAPVRSGRGEGTRLVVAEVVQGGPAAGDVSEGWEILSVNGERMSSIRQLERFGMGLEGGDLISLVLHDGEGERVVNYRARP